MIINTEHKLTEMNKWIDRQIHKHSLKICHWFSITDENIKDKSHKDIDLNIIKNHDLIVIYKASTPSNCKMVLL